MNSPFKRKVAKPGSADALTREEKLAVINEKATDSELALLVKLFNNPTFKNIALNEAQKYL